MRAQLEEKLKRLPACPGVYLFKDTAESVIYVGKAKILKDRVRSYFHASVTDPKVKAIVSKAVDLDWILTGSDVEALVLENTLIKKHRPYYNIDLKDDKRYPYLRVSIGESFPRIEVVRDVVRDGAKYFGPYVETTQMRRVLKLIEKLFQIRTCTIVLPAKAGTRPCLNMQIGKCPGLCQGIVSEEEYKQRVKQALLLLSGHGEALLKALDSSMEQSANSLDFEKAAALRDQIVAVKKTLFRQRMRMADMVDRDILALAVDGRLACVALFNMREGLVTGRYHFFLKLIGGEAHSEILGRFIQGHYIKEMDIPDEIMLPELPEETSVLENWLQEEAGKNVHLRKPQIGEKLRLLETCTQNAEMLLQDYLAERDKISGRIPASVAALKKELRLDCLPMTIEAYDISHVQGHETVASRVLFVNGAPRKSGYRHYNVKTVEGVDDFASLAEVLGRRIRSAMEENDTLPDLLLIDGGKGQLSAVRQQLLEAGLKEQPVISLAKRLEEVFVPEQSDPLMIPKKSPALHLLQRIRDEAHRFAVTFHRKKRGRSMASSVLDTIDGIGEKRKIMLLKKFGSVEAIQETSENMLLEAGLSPAMVQKVKEGIKKRQDS